MNLGVDSGQPGFSMADAEGTGAAGITFTKDGPSVTLEDGRGFPTVVGATQFETTAKGVAHQTSAASVMLFGKDKKVTWQAP